MPLYEYKCIACEAQIEVQRPMNESGSGYECPVCHQPMERQYSVPEISVIKKRPHGFYPPERLDVRR